MGSLEASLKSSRVLRQYEFLAEAARVATETEDQQVSTEPLHKFGKERYNMEWRAVDQDITALSEQEHLWFERSGAGIGSFFLNRSAYDAVEDFETLRRDKRKRALAIRKAFLDWMYDEHHEGNTSPIFDRFLKSDKNTFYGATFTEPELQQATMWLREEGHVKGTAVSGGFIVRPTLTTKGMKVVENDEPLSGPATTRGGDVNTYNIDVKDSHGFNMAVASPGAVQSNSLTTEQVQKAKELAEAFSLMIPAFGLSSADEQDGIATRDALEAELVEADPEPGKVKQLVSKAMEIAALGTTGGIVEAFIGLGQKYLESM